MIPIQRGEAAGAAYLLDNNGSPGQSRTADLRFRKPLLYPSELQGHKDLRHQLSIIHRIAHKQPLLDFSLCTVLDSQQGEQLGGRLLNCRYRLRLWIVPDTSVIVGHFRVHVAMSARPYKYRQPDKSGLTPGPFFTTMRSLHRRL